MPPRVLFVAQWYPSYDLPGRGSFVADLATALSNAGAEVVVASFEPIFVRGDEATRAERGRHAQTLLAAAVTDPGVLTVPHGWGSSGVPVARLPVVLDPSGRLPGAVAEGHAAALVPFGVALAERWPFDVIHAHGGLPDGVAATRLSERLGVPLLITEHSSTVVDELADPDAAGLYRQLLEPNAAGPSRRLVAVSQALADRIATRLGADPGLVGVLPNAVPIDAFPLGPNSDRDPNELLFVGARRETKGLETLLGAFAIARRQRPELRLRIIGPPGPDDQEERWHAMVAENALADAVSFEPPADREVIARAMRRASIFVHPSPFETFGMVAAEALASGLPVAATPSGGVEEVLGGSGPCGEMADSAGAAALATAILRLWERRATVDPSVLRDRVAGRFAAPAVAGRVIDTYQSLLDESRQPSLAMGTHNPAASSPSAAPDRERFEPPLIVGLASVPTATRLSELPQDLIEQLSVVTSPRAPGPPPIQQPRVARWLELDPDALYREQRLKILPGRRRGKGIDRWLGLLRVAIWRWRVRQLERRRGELQRQTTIEFLQAAAQPGIGAGDVARSSRAIVLCLEADDILAVEPVLTAEIALAPGSLRWLVDRWDAAGRPSGR